MLSAMRYQITVRHGDRYQRYHTFTVEAEDAREALRRGAEGMPEKLVVDADLVEVRVAVDPESREYVGEDA